MHREEQELALRPQALPAADTAVAILAAAQVQQEDAQAALVRVDAVRSRNVQSLNTTRRSSPSAA